MSKHQGVSCDACQRNNFSGKRYKCLICYDYDLCAECYNGRHVISEQSRTPSDLSAEGSSEDDHVDVVVTPPAVTMATDSGARGKGRTLPPKKRPHPRGQSLSSASSNAPAPSGVHDRTHIMQCILTSSDYDVCFGGENVTRHALAFACPLCGQLGFSDKSLYDHVVGEHAKSRKEFICPICAGNPSRDPNCMVDDFPTHYNLEHKTAYREIRAHASNSSSSGGGGGAPPSSTAPPKRRGLGGALLQRTGAVRNRPDPAPPLSSLLAAYLDNRNGSGPLADGSSFFVPAPGTSSSRNPFWGPPNTSGRKTVPVGRERKKGAPARSFVFGGAGQQQQGGPPPRRSGLFVKLTESAEATTADRPLVVLAGVDDEGDDPGDSSLGAFGLLDDLTAELNDILLGGGADHVIDGHVLDEEEEEGVDEDDLMEEEELDSSSASGEGSSSGTSEISGATAPFTESTEEVDDVIASSIVWQQVPEPGKNIRKKKRKDGSSSRDTSRDDTRTEDHVTGTPDSRPKTSTTDTPFTDESDEGGTLPTPSRSRKNSKQKPPLVIRDTGLSVDLEREVSSTWKALDDFVTNGESQEEEVHVIENDLAATDHVDGSSSRDSKAAPKQQQNSNTFKANVKLESSNLLASELDKYMAPPTGADPAPPSDDVTSARMGQRALLLRRLFATSLLTESSSTVPNSVIPNHLTTELAPLSRTFWDRNHVTADDEVTCHTAAHQQCKSGLNRGAKMDRGPDPATPCNKLTKRNNQVKCNQQQNIIQNGGGSTQGVRVRLTGGSRDPPPLPATSSNHNKARRQPPPSMSAVMRGGVSTTSSAPHPTSSLRQTSKAYCVTKEVTSRPSTTNGPTPSSAALPSNQQPTTSVYNGHRRASPRTSPQGASTSRGGQS